MSETPDITNLFRSKHDSWDPDSELGSIIYLTREPITKIPTKAIVIASNEVMKSRGNNCKIVSRDPQTKTSRLRTEILGLAVCASLIIREAGGDTLCNEVARNVDQNGHLHRGQCRAVKSSGEFYITDPWIRTVSVL